MSDKLEAQFPEHKCSLTLTHNEHKDVYETVEQFTFGRHFNFISDDERNKCIKNDELWTLQWYPSTPVGFYIVSGATLETVLKAALEIESYYKG